jgi:predicted sulfurtransferase
LQLRISSEAAEELSLKGLLNKRGIKGKLQGMKGEAAGHQKKIEKLMQRVSESEGLNQDSMQKKHQKRHHK